MKLKPRALFLILIALYIGAVWARIESLDGFAYPYYNGESGTNFRHAHEIADRGTLPSLDAHASWPEGYSPSRVKPNGVEYFTGFAFRLVQPFSDISDRRFSGILTILFFSLSVYTVFALTRHLWNCQAAGLLAAFLAAFSAPLIDSTNGKEFLHAPYAFVLASLHLALFLRYMAKPSWARAIVAGLAGFVLLASWGSAPLYVGAFGLGILLLSSLTPDARRRIFTAHLVAVLLAGIAMPHLRADRAVFGWPAVWVLVITLYAFFRDKLPRKIPGWVYVAGAFVLLTLVLAPVRSGGATVLDPLTYVYYRLRFIAGKPENPLLLPDIIRLAWTSDHAPPRIYTLVAFFLPLVFLAMPATAALTVLKKERDVPAKLLAASIAIGIAAFVIDRRAVFSAALVLFPFVSGALRDFRPRIRTRILPVTLAVAAVILGSPFAPATSNAVRRAAGRLGLSPDLPDGFSWVSVGNPDRELVRFLVTRTSTRSDAVLAGPRVSPVVATFAGRATAIAPGVLTLEMARKTARSLARFYGDEDGLYAWCDSLKVTYVVYSIDMLLDESSYSPRYMSGVATSNERVLAYTMHFAPETLRRFQLVYENDNYRVFRVTADVKPVFLTDHPPVYQKEILRTYGGGVGAFYSRILDVLSTYQTAVDAQSRGDEEGAIRRFRYCLDQAPYFSKAWLGIGDSYLRLSQPDKAHAAYAQVLGYAPDNTHALYYGALSLAYTGRKEEATRLIDVLLSATAESDIRSQAVELKRVLASGRPLEMPRQAEPSPSK